MKQGPVIGARYAHALYASLSAEKDKTLGALETLARGLEEHHALCRALGHPNIPMEVKLDLLCSLVDAPEPDLWRGFLGLLLKARRIELLGEVATAFKRLVKAEQKWEEATVTTAVQLSSEREGQVAAVLGGLFPGVQVRVHFAHDPSLLGGMFVSFEHRVIDLSLRSRLAALIQAAVS